MALTTYTYTEGATRTVAAFDPATRTSVVLYRGPIPLLAAEAHRHLTRYIASHPAATLADVRTVFHTADEAR